MEQQLEAFRHELLLHRFAARVLGCAGVDHERGRAVTDCFGGGGLQAVARERYVRADFHVTSTPGPGELLMSCAPQDLRRASVQDDITGWRFSRCSDR